VRLFELLCEFPRHCGGRWDGVVLVES
jgi:hypothetical protein